MKALSPCSVRSIQLRVTGEIVALLIIVFGSIATCLWIVGGGSAIEMPEVKTPERPV